MPFSEAGNPQYDHHFEPRRCIRPPARRLFERIGRSLDALAPDRDRLLDGRRGGFPGTASTSAYTAGLLHDIGKVALSDSLTPYSSEIIAGLGKGENGDFAGSERRVLHMDHAEAGWLLAQQWNIPDSICAVVRYHHAPENAPEEHRELCIAVHIGDILAMLGGYGTGADTLSYRIDPLAEEVLRHHNDTVVKLMLNIEGEFVKSQRRLRELSGEKHV